MHTHNRNKPIGNDISILVWNTRLFERKLSLSHVVGITNKGVICVEKQNMYLRRFLLRS